MVKITSARSGESSSNPGTWYAVATDNQEGTKLIENPRQVFSRRKGTSALGSMAEHFDLKSRTEENFKVAHHQSAWFDAIEKKDCKRLMELLAENPRLLVETGAEGRTVLHVASMQGCLRLVTQVMDIVEGKDVSSGEGIGLSREKILKAIDGQTMMTAFDLAWLMIGNKGVARRLDDRSVEVKDRDEGLYGSEGRDTSEDDELKSVLQNVIQEVLDQKNRGFEYLKQEFDEDVDYNFELSGPGLIYIFHHALVTGWVTFVQEVSRKCKYSNVGGLFDYLWRVQDWKGRPSFLLLFNVRYISDGFMWHFLRRTFMHENYDKYCRDIVDSRGWTLLHWAATYDELNEDKRYAECDMNARLPNHSYGATLHLAIIHGQEDVVNVFVQDKRTDLNAILDESSLCIGKRPHLYLSPLIMAVVVGNERIVGLLLSQVWMTNTFRNSTHT